MEYKHKEFPKWIYSKDEGSKVVETIEEKELCGSTWFESPADFDSASPLDAEIQAVSKKKKKAAVEE